MNAQAFLDAIPQQDLEIAAIERAQTMPSAWYTNPAFLDIDTTFILSQNWQYVGHMAQLASQGDFITAQVGNESVVVVRGADDEVRAFYNVCRHRGGPLATESCGRIKMLQCKYHGWTYKLDGTLRGVPRFNRVDLFDRRDYGLKPVEVQTWEGLLFVRLQDGGVELERMLDGIAARIAPIQLGALHFYKRIPYEVKCNWKVYVDNYLEGYHLPFVHPELCNVLDYTEYVTETYPYYSLQHSPIDGKDGIYDAEGGQAYYYFIYPNIALNILPGRLQTNTIRPLGHDRTLVLFDYFYEDVSSPEAKLRIEEDLGFSDQVQQEDIMICEHVQRGLMSAAYDKGRFSVECEQGVYHFQSLLKKAYLNARNRLEQA